MTRAVLILTHAADVHADAVEAHIKAAGVEVRRVDTTELCTSEAPVSIHLDNATITGNVAGIDLARVVGVWHRRPSDFTTTDLTDGAELRAGVGGILTGLPYLNHPADMAVAGFKPLQLAIASRCGLRVPETVITSVRPIASTIAARLGDEVVVKPMSRHGATLLHESDRSGWLRPIHLTQQRITTTRHVRLTVVDGTMFAARIESPHLDWRRDISQCRYELTETPVQIAGPVRRLLAIMRLRFAVLDFAVDHSGQWWFLEVNPNGQWLWLEHATGLPIGAAIAKALYRVERYTRARRAQTPQQAFGTLLRSRREVLLRNARSGWRDH